MPLHVTFLCCLGFSLDWGIIVGIVANLLLILYDAARPNIDIQTLEVRKHKCIERTTL
jgi:MFS superfamily sulfate permease-like transporter